MYFAFLRVNTTEPGVEIQGEKKSVMCYFNGSVSHLSVSLRVSEKAKYPLYKSCSVLPI